MTQPPQGHPAGFVPQHSSSSLLSKGPEARASSFVGWPQPLGAQEATPEGLSGLLAEPQWPCPSPWKGQRHYFSRRAAPPPTPQAFSVPRPP